MPSFLEIMSLYPAKHCGKGREWEKFFDFLQKNKEKTIVRIGFAVYNGLVAFKMRLLSNYAVSIKKEDVQHGKL